MMSRKPGAVSKETRQRLLEAASAEFAAVGFQKASLRAICAKAGVTTGALYFFFKGKDDLFAKTVEDTGEKILAYVKEHYGADAPAQGRGLMGDEESDFKTAEGLYDLLEQERPATTIIAQNREHPVVKEFSDKVVAEMYEYLRAVVQQQDPALLEMPEYDDVSLNWLARVQLDSFFELYNMQMDEARTRHQLEVMVRSFRGGFRALLSQES
jgi:AcrR family transcriptional regulator